MKRAKQMEALARQRFDRQVAKGIRDLDEGRVLSNEEAEAHLDQFMAILEAKIRNKTKQRLFSLSEQIGRTPEETLNFVIRDGIDECEAKAAAVLMSMEEARSGQLEDPDTESGRND